MFGIRGDAPVVYAINPGFTEFHKLSWIEAVKEESPILCMTSLFLSKEGPRFEKKLIN